MIGALFSLRRIARIDPPPLWEEHSNDHRPGSTYTSPASASPILEVRDVTKTYGEGHTAVTAIADASLSVNEGQFVPCSDQAVPGKTTLILNDRRLLTPTSGTIRLGDAIVSDMSKKELTNLRAERVGFVFRPSNLVPFPHRSREPAVRREPPEEARPEGGGEASGRAARRTGSQRERANNIPEKLSGGECQRVAPGAH